MLANETSFFRDRAPTLPHDLAEYAREETGPSSWSAHPQAEELSAWLLEAHEDPISIRTTDVLVEIGPTDVPRVVVQPELVMHELGHREAFVLASIDGASTVETMVDLVDLPAGALLQVLCRLCARGFVSLDRSSR